MGIIENSESSEKRSCELRGISERSPVSDWSHRQEKKRGGKSFKNLEDRASGEGHLQIAHLGSADGRPNH